MINLDPDFRNNTKNINKPHCCRCQKNFKNNQGYLEVTVNWDNWEVSLGGKELLGKDCAKKIGLLG